MKSKLVMAVGGAMIVMGLTIAAFPEQFFAVVDWESRAGQYIAAAIRIVVGLILLFAASETRVPTGFRIFGGLVLLAGVVLPLIPLELWAALIRWVTFESPAVIRIGAGVGGSLLGAFLVHAARPGQSDG